MADVAVKSFEFRVVAVYALNCAGERRSFFRRLGPFLDDSKRLVLMDDWNAILDPKLDRDRDANGSDRCESSLIDLLAEYDLVDRFRLDHPGWETWTWLGDSLSGQIRSYLNRVLVRRADSDFVTCPTFHWIGQTDHKLVRVSLRLVNRPSLAGYWKFNTSLLEIRDFLEHLEKLILRVLLGAVTGNKWWGSLKYRIRDFAIKYGRQLKLDRTKKVKSLDDRLSRAVERVDSLTVDLARQKLERETSERYKGFVVRTRLKRASNEAVKCNAFCMRKKCEDFPIGASISSSLRIGTRYSRIVRCATPFGRTFVVALPAILTFRFRSFAAI